jgi:trigger factor
VTIPIYPVVDPGPYTDARVESVDATVDDAAVDEVIERLRKTHSPWVDPVEPGLEVGPDLVLERKGRTPRDGDQVTVDYSVREGETPVGEPVVDAVFVLGESNLLDRMREEIEKLRVGESTTFEVAFPEDDESIDPDRRGKTFTYAITLKGLKERDLLPLDDDFARTAAEVDTLDELRREIRDDLHQGKTAEARGEVLNQIIERMAETATIDLPAPMIDEAVEEDLRAFRGRLAQQRVSLEEYLRLSDQTEDDLRVELRPAAARRLRNSLLLREIAKREGIAVDPAEVDTEVDRLATAAGAGADPERLRQFYTSDYFRNVLRGDLFERRVTDRLIELATEGRGAVLNGWVEPEPAPESEPESGPDAVAPGDATTPATDPTAASTNLEPNPTIAAEPAGPVAASDPTALDEALTLATMPGQPADLAESPAPVGGDAPGPIDDVVTAQTPAGAASGPDPGEAETPAAAATPEEREAQGEPGAGGSLPNPTY